MRAIALSLFASLSLAACSSNTTGTNSGGLELSCGSTETVCSNACTTLQSDPLNCGACGTACAAGQICTAGKCVTTCPAESLLCTNTCVDPRADNLNCGTCGTACTTGTSCINGSCTPFTEPPITCGVGLTTCSLLDGGISCPDVSNDAFNCGTCNHECPAGETCTSGQCQAACVSSQISCGNQCVNPKTDNQNCGGCFGDGGLVCSAGEVCNGFGQCLATCASPLAFCSGLRPTPADAGVLPDAGNADAGYCADLGSDPLNCGSCDNACPGGNLCVDGQCQLICPPSGESCQSPVVLLDAGTFTGNTCCGSTLGLTSGTGCTNSTSTLTFNYQLPQGAITDGYAFQLTSGFVGTFSPGVCFSEASLSSLVCTNTNSTFPSLSETDYLAVGQLDGGCGPFTLTVGLNSLF